MIVPYHATLNVKAAAGFGTAGVLGRGTSFSGKPYGSDVADYSAAGKLKSETFYTGANETGGIYLAENVTSDGTGSHFVYTQGSIFAGKPYQSEQLDYNTGGTPTAATFYTGANKSGPVYLAERLAGDGSGGTDRSFDSGTYFSGKPYGSYVADYNTAGTLVSETFYKGPNETGGIYMG